MRSALLFLLLILQVAPAPAETRFEKRAREKQAIAQSITWPLHEPLIFHLRRGDHEEDWAEFHERQHDPANIQRLADVGTRWERLPFYKGYGLVMEMPEIQKSREMAERMHALGMKVSLYVAGTMFIEAFYREVPEAARWEQKDQVGRAVPYSGTQTYRHFPCPNEPAYRDYLKKVLRLGVEELKADEIFFDNIFLQPEPKSCRCARCLKGFTEFLRQRYPTKETALRRFGYPDADYVQVSEWYEFNRPEQLDKIDDPVLQEWIAFRNESLARHCGDLYDFVKGLNPKIAVGFNLKGLYGSNRIWRNAVHHPLFKGKIDFSPFDTSGMDARIDERTGALVSEIRAYKMARTLGYSYQTRPTPLELAVHMAFNPQKLVPGFGYEGGPRDFPTHRTLTADAEFFREYNDRYFTDTASVADVAVLRTWPSMAYRVSATLTPTILMEQVLIQHKVPFDIIFDGEMDRIGRYQAVVLPGQESLSQQWVDRLAAYARGGGTVVFTGNTADYNDWREKRRTNPLLALMGNLTAGIAVAPLGKGKMVYIPTIIPGKSKRSAAAGAPANVMDIATGSSGRSGDLGPADCVLPANHEDIRRAVAANLRDGLAIETDAPPTVVMELFNRQKTRETIVHFVNFDHGHPVAPFAVRLKKQLPGAVKAVKLFSPQSDEPQELTFTEERGRIAFTAPALPRYAMVVVEHR